MNGECMCAKCVQDRNKTPWPDQRNVMQQQVRDFMDKTEQVRGDDGPALRDELLRVRLITEEAMEVCLAVYKGDLVEAVDGLCDLLYVTFGTFEAFGVDAQTFFNEVHRTNMLKTVEHKDKFGKVVKPPGWQPPKIHELLLKAGWRGGEKESEL